MDQYTVGGGNGDFSAQQVMPAYAPMQTPPERAGKKLRLWIVCGTAALVVAAVVLVLCLTPGGTGSSNLDPLIFMEDDDVYLTVGAETIQLDDAAFGVGYDGQYLNATASVDGKTLYYLADVNSNSGEGDLMRITLGNANAKPERIAEDVYSARISPDDKKVLYISDYEDGEGDLYLCTPGGKPEQIGESVVGRSYSFTPNAGIVYYAMVNNSDGFTLLQYSGGKSTEIADVDDASLSGMYMDDNGRMMYKAYNYEDSEYTLYLYANGDSERICRDTEYIYTYPIDGSAAEFLYSSEDSLYYYSRGDEESITDAFYGIDFLQHYERYDPRQGNGGHLMFSEGETSEDLTLYEVSLPGEPVKISKMDGSYIVSENGATVAYVSNNKLYFVKKTGSSWGSREKVCESVWNYAFDESGRYLYYIAADGESYSGELCRIPLSGGEEEVLMRDVTQYLLSGSQVYAIDEDGEAYFIVNEDDSESIEDDITAIYEAADGVYMVGSDGDLYYYNGRESERISRSAVVVWCNGYITGMYD